MVTQAVGNLAVNIALAAREDANLGQAFDRTARRIEEIQEAQKEANQAVRDFQRESRGVRRSSEEYERLQREIDQAKRRQTSLNRELAEVKDIQERNRIATASFTRHLTASAVAIGAVSAAVVFGVRSQADYHRELENTAITTGFAREELERYQKALTLVAGRDVDIDVFHDLALRFQEVNDELETNSQRGQDVVRWLEGAGRSVEDYQEALRGGVGTTIAFFQAVQRGTTDQNLNLADVLGGDEAGRVINQAANAAVDWNTILGRVSVTSDETVQSLKETDEQVTLLSDNFVVTATELGSFVIPPFTQFVSHLNTGLGYVRDLNEQIPILVPGLFGIAGGVWAGRTAWLAYNVVAGKSIGFNAVLAALQGPQGWARLAVAATIAAAAGLGLFFLTRGSGGGVVDVPVVRERIQEQQLAISQGARQGTEQGIRETTREIAQTAAILGEACPDDSDQPTQVPNAPGNRLSGGGAFGGTTLDFSRFSTGSQSGALLFDDESGVSLATQRLAQRRQEEVAQIIQGFTDDTPLDRGVVFTPTSTRRQTDAEALASYEMRQQERRDRLQELANLGVTIPFNPGLGPITFQQTNINPRGSAQQLAEEMINQSNRNDRQGAAR